MKEVTREEVEYVFVQEVTAIAHRLGLKELDYLIEDKTFSNKPNELHLIVKVRLKEDER